MYIRDPVFESLTEDEGFEAADPDGNGVGWKFATSTYLNESALAIVQKR